MQPLIMLRSKGNFFPFKNLMKLIVGFGFLLTSCQSAMLTSKSCKGKSVKGLKQGTWTCFYPNGTPSTITNFDNGIKNGEFIAYFENGQIDVRNFWKNGMMDGELTSYNRSGQIEVINAFKEGKYHGLSKGYSPKGQLTFQCSYFENKRNGPCSGWYDDGGKEFEAIFEMDELKEYKDWYQNQKVRTFGLSDQRKQAMTWKYFTESGTEKPQHPIRSYFNERTVQSGALG